MVYSRREQHRKGAFFMRRAGIILAAAVLAVLLAACSGGLPDVPDEAAIQADLPQELTAVTIGGEEQELQIESLAVTERDTDLTKQTDDVTCAVVLRGEGFTLSYTCILNYAYVRSSGWTIRDWELAEDAVLTPDADVWSAQLCAESTALLEESGYADPELTAEVWSDDGTVCTQTFSSREAGEFLTVLRTVSVTGTLTRTGSGFAYEWTKSAEADGETVTVTLEGTVWHLLAESENLEIVFQIESADETAVVFSGLIRAENLLGAVRESTLSVTESEYTVTEYGSITFDLTAADGETLTVHIQEDAQWVTSGDLYLTALQQETMPASGDLSDLMELEEDDLRSFLLPDEDGAEEENEEAEDGTEDSASPDAEGADGTEDAAEDSLRDAVTGLWDQLQDFWNSLW